MISVSPTEREWCPGSGQAHREVRADCCDRGLHRTERALRPIRTSIFLLRRPVCYPLHQQRLMLAVPRVRFERTL